MQAFVDAVAAELERPRALLKQVVDHLASHYSVSRDELGAFLTGQIEALEKQLGPPDTKPAEDAPMSPSDLKKLDLTLKKRLRSTLSAMKQNAKSL